MEEEEGEEEEEEEEKELRERIWGWGNIIGYNHEYRIVPN